MSDLIKKLEGLSVVSAEEMAQHGGYRLHMSDGTYVDFTADNEHVLLGFGVTYTGEVGTDDTSSEV